MPGRVNFCLTTPFEGRQVLAEDSLQLFQYQIVNEKSTVGISFFFNLKYITVYAPC
jgi:hypothetical protein